MPGHMGIDGNEIADQLARQGSSHPLTGPASALGISGKVARGVIKFWTSGKHKDYWESIHGQRLAKYLLKRPCATSVRELRSLSRNQLTIMTGLLTGRCHLKGLLTWGW
jgi:hypothetical protein